MSMNSSINGKARGFAAMEPERRRDVSRKGGIAAHLKGTAHQWNPSTAREAGRKGGLARRAKKHPAPVQDPSARQRRPENAATNDKLGA